MRLNLDYIDLYLIHSPHGKNKRIEQWRALVDLKEAGKIKPTPIGGTPEKEPVQFCPEGTLPPCKTSTLTKTVKPTTTQNKFLQNFRAYNSGGVSSGPPPKRGPNPQVPPIKMRSGKMTKTYKMSCPHRPDGIRGVGAAIKGHKFIGVK